MRDGFIHVRKDGDRYAILGDGVDVCVSRKQLEGIVGASEAVLRGAAESEAQRKIKADLTSELQKIYQPDGRLLEVAFIFEAKVTVANQYM